MKSSTTAGLALHLPQAVLYGCGVLCTLHSSIVCIMHVHTSAIVLKLVVLQLLLHVPSACKQYATICCALLLAHVAMPCILCGYLLVPHGSDAG
jgi:hypothetical protein